MRSRISHLLVAGMAVAAIAAEPAVEPAPRMVSEPLFSFNPAAPVGPQASRLDVSGEYIYWWLREGRIPATLATSSFASKGLLGQPDTQVLYGDQRLETRHADHFIGGRIKVGWWFDDAQSLGVEGTAFFLERDSTHYKAVSDGNTLLARPYFNPDGSPASEIIAGPAPTGLRNGQFVGYSRIELFGEEVNLIAPILVGANYRVDGLAGARFLQMRDRTDLTATGRSLPDQATLFGLTDHYRIHNAYYGGQAGLRGEISRGRWTLNLRGETGLGGNEQQIRNFGDRVLHTPGNRVVTQGGLTVQASNTGQFERTTLNMVSEVAINIGYRLTAHCQLFGGYTFLLWDSPIRSGDQIDLVVNTVPGTAPARPGVPFKEDLFWAQGLNVGLGFSW